MLTALMSRSVSMAAFAGRAGLRGHLASALLAALAVPVLLAAGCGSSKPAFCMKSDELKSAVNHLTHLDLAKEGIAGAEAAIHKVQSSANALVEAAKSEFPQQSEAVANAAKALAESVKAASNGQESSSAIAAIPAEIVALGRSAESFAEAAKSKCE